MKKQKIINIIGLFLVLCGLICFIIKCLSNEYIDSNGVLHEYFFLLPIGYLCIFVGIILLVLKKFIKK